MSLNGLEDLSDAVASSLSKYQGAPVLNGIQALTPSAAKCLGDHEGALLLGGLKELSEGAASNLARNDGNLALDSIETISKPVAKILAEHRGDLWLDGLRALEKVEAAILATHCGALSLGGLQGLGAGVACALADHEGNLSLGGLEVFDEKDFDTFAKHKGRVTVPMLLDMQSVASTEGDDDREFIVGVDFVWGSEVSYNGFRIMSRQEIRNLFEALQKDAEIQAPNAPEHFEEETHVENLKNSFNIRSPWPSDVEAMRRIFGETVGDTSLFDCVLEAEPRSEDNEEDDED